MSLSMSMILLSKPGLPTAEAVASELRTRWPDLPGAAGLETKDGTISFQVGAFQVVAALMPAPVPWSDLEFPCQSSWIWENAEAELKPHEAHIIVTVSGDTPPIQRILTLTVVTAAIVAACPEAIGVFWTDSQLVMQRSLFLDFATETAEFPIFIWLNMQVGQNENGTCSGYTLGMTAFELMDFETEDCSESPGDLRERFAGMAGYLIEKGPVINDGDTIGVDENERISVVYSPSAFGHEGQVMKLVYSKPDKPKKAWWKKW